LKRQEEEGGEKGKKKKKEGEMKFSVLYPPPLQTGTCQKGNPPGVKGALSIKNVGGTIKDDTRVWGDK